MRIREVTNKDIPSIIDLLKLSLGEGSTPKSAEYWQWKHVHNPFGSSPALVEEENGQLTGIRAFMRWNWIKDGHTYSALRAVDTATHPDYQGRGIFKKLTIQLMENCRESGDDFIFNTPNEQSLPGYLKMGWKNIGRLPVRLKLCHPLQIALRQVGLGQKSKLVPMISEELSAKNVLPQWKERLMWLPLVVESGLHTPKSYEYIDWRYAQCPVQNYYVLAGEKYLLIFYPRAHSFGKELRIAELLMGAEEQQIKTMGKRFRSLCKETKIDFVSVAPPKQVIAKRWLRKQAFLPAFQIGPILTFRPLQKNVEYLMNKRLWHYQIGDLELF